MRWLRRSVEAPSPGLAAVPWRRRAGVIEVLRQKCGLDVSVHRVEFSSEGKFSMRSSRKVSRESRTTHDLEKRNHLVVGTSRNVMRCRTINASGNLTREKHRSEILL